MFRTITSKAISYLFLALGVYCLYRTTTDVINYWGIWVTPICFMIAYREKIARYERGL